MFTEIEAKLKVDSLAEVENKLRELGGEFIAEQDQSDIHFDDSNASLSKADKCLRLRRQVVGETRKFFLTYKGAKEKSNFKRRQEIEFEVGNAESAEKLIAALGYERRLSVDKKRCLWKLGGCEVALDRLKELGEFVEIEGPDDKKISEVQKSLGLENVPHIAKSYAAMIKEKTKSGKE